MKLKTVASSFFLSVMLVAGCTYMWFIRPFFPLLDFRKPFVTNVMNSYGNCLYLFCVF